MTELPDETTFQPGEPGQWTPAQRTRNQRMSAFLRALYEDGTISGACTQSGVSEPSIWRWRKDFPAFAAAVDDFMTHTRVQQLEESLYRIARNTDPKVATAAVRASEFLLKAYDRPRFGDQLRTESTVTVNQQVQVIHEVRDTFRQRQLKRLRTIDVPPADTVS